MTPLIPAIELIFRLLSFAILARVVLSWFNLSPYHPVMNLLNRLTDPILEPLRRVIPPIGMIDMTPILALIILQVVERIVLVALRGG